MLEILKNLAVQFEPNLVMAGELCYRRDRVNKELMAAISVIQEHIVLRVEYYNRGVYATVAGLADIYKDGSRFTVRSSGKIPVKFDTNGHTPYSIILIKVWGRNSM